MAPNSQTPAVKQDDIQSSKLLKLLNSFRMQNIVPEDSSRLGKLCHTCRSVLDKWDAFLKEIERERRALYTIPNYHQNMVTWMIEVESGCVLCMRLFDSLPKEGAQKLRQRLVGDFTIELSLNLDTVFSEPWNLSFTVEETGKDETHLQIKGKVHLMPKNNESCYRAFELAPSTGSDISLAFAKGWIETCRISHKRCRRERVGRLPTRLLELHEGGIRLCVAVNATLCRDYVTLSHCWGTLEILKLKTNNIAMLSRGIPEESLCKTFQDAAKVTRALGYSFLWIDSLCIVQDDEDDWRKESALMKEVYANAIVNLAATDAKDGSVGLFRERDVSRASRQYIQTSTSHPNNPNTGQINSQIFELMDDKAYYRCLSRTLLSSRAWAFQERYLAERTIHFTSEQLFCECRYHVTCEAWPKGMKPALARMGDIPFPGRAYQHGQEEEWRQIVLHYSRAKLTYPKDKLVALSGVAHKHQEMTRDKYVAGLWRNSLERYLCWAVERILENQLPASGAHSTPYRAPSWSWASQDRSITWRLSNNVNAWTNSNSLILIDILDIDLVPVGPDALGQLQDAKMRLRCGPIIKGNVILELLNASSKPRNDAYKVHIEDDMDIPIEVFCDVYPDLSIEYKSMVEPLHFLPILAGENGQADRSIRFGYPKAASISGLILQRADERGLGYFTRFGVCYITRDVPHHSDLMKLFSERSDCFMDEALYEEILEADENERKRYVITLV